MDGWVKLHRKILENPIFKNAELFQLFIYCLLNANHKDGKAFYGSQEIDVKKGQFITGRFTLSKDLNQNESGLYKRLKRLESLTMIGLKSNNKNTIVTITNWEFYQSDLCDFNKEVTALGQQSNNKVTTKEQQSNNKVTQPRMKECKNERMKEENKMVFFENELVNGAFLKFVDMRKKEKPQPTEHAFNLLVDELNRLTDDNDIKIKIINKSIMCSWKGLFALKESNSWQAKEQKEASEWIPKENSLAAEEVKPIVSKPFKKDELNKDPEGFWRKYDK